MNLADQTLRVAALAAVRDYFDAQYKTARAEAEAAYKANGVKKLAISLPDGQEIGEVTVLQPSPAVKIDDDDLLAWVEKHTPTEVEEYLDSAALLDQELIEWARENRDDLLRRRIRKVWRDELQKTITANGGHVVDPETGDSQQVAKVTVSKPSGAFALSADKYKERANRIMASLLAGELKGVVELPALAITGGSSDD